MPTFATLVTAVAMAGGHMQFWACIACTFVTPHWSDLAGVMHVVWFSEAACCSTGLHHVA